MSEFNLSFTPLLPWALLAAFAVLAVAVTALGLYRRRSGTLLRALGLALVLFALTDPALVREDRQNLQDVVALVVDQSASQTIGERTQQTQAEREALQKGLE